MKESLKSAKRECLTLKEIEERLLKANIQPTAQRLAICRYVLCEADHPTAENVKQWADANFPKLSLATVYNTMKVLVDAGILREFRFPHSDKVIYDANLEDHYHFLDEATGRLWDLEPEQLAVIPKLGKGFQVNSVQVLLRGKRR